MKQIFAALGFFLHSWPRAKAHRPQRQACTLTLSRSWNVIL